MPDTNVNEWLIPAIGGPVVGAVGVWFVIFWTRHTLRGRREQPYISG